MDVSIRLATADDATQLQDLLCALDEESTFLLKEPGERRRRDELPDLSYRVVAADGGRLVGQVAVLVQPFARVRHRGHVIMGVRASHTGRGLGRKLLETAIAQARRRGLTRLELSVMIHNQIALALYTRCGFQVEGLRRASAWVEGQWVDEFHMGLLL